MFSVLSRIFRWAFSRTTMVLAIWIVGIVGAATFLAIRHYTAEMPEAQALKIAQVTKLRGELEKLDQDRVVLQEIFEENAKAVVSAVASTAAEAKASFERAQALRKSIAQLNGKWNRVRGVFDPSVTYEVRMKEREVEEEKKRSEALIARLKVQTGERDLAAVAHRDALASLDGQRAAISADADAAQADLDVMSAERSRWFARYQGATYWLSRGAQLIFWTLVIATVSIVVAPFLIKVFLYYVWAPVISFAGVVRLRKKDDVSPQIPPPIIDVSKTEVAQEITLQPGEFAIIKPKFYQASDDDLEKRTKFIFDWRYPFTSMACGLIEMTRVTNPGAGGKRPESARSFTLSSQDDAEIEMAVITLPEDTSLVCRPSFLAGLIGEDGLRPCIKTHWRLFSLHAWLTFQFRYFEFRGPGRIALWARRGVRAERLGSSGRSPEESRRRTNQDATIGFTPGLGYRSVRAETFWAYLRNENPLFDDLFSGQGIFLCQQIPKAGAAGKSKRFWGGVWNGMTKVLGI